MAAGPRITAIVAAFNEADIIQQTVGDLVRQAIAVHVIDDGSTDGTAAALEPLLASGLVTIERGPAPDAGSRGGAFQWARILARKEQLARELDSDWFLHHDADEFRESPWRNLNLRQGIELVDRLGFNAIDFAVLNFWPTHDGFDGKADIRDVFQHCERGAEFDRVQVKCWKKAPDVDLQSSGGHDARFAARRVFPLRFLLRHFPIRSQAHGRRKVFEERVPRFVEGERQRGWHVQYEGLSPDHRFTRDPATLEPYDADAVRAMLALEHRGLEELRAEVEQRGRELEKLRLEADALGRALRDEQAARASDVAARDHHARELVARHDELDARFRQLEERYRALDDGYKDLQRERAALLRSVEELERQLFDIRRSWSWKLTAPVRALLRPRG